MIPDDCKRSFQNLTALSRQVFCGGVKFKSSSRARRSEIEGPRLTSFGVTRDFSTDARDNSFGDAHRMHRRKGRVQNLTALGRQVFCGGVRFKSSSRGRRSEIEGPRLTSFGATRDFSTDARDNSFGDAHRMHRRKGGVQNLTALSRQVFSGQFLSAAAAANMAANI